MTKKIIIIGGGPGGYAAAIRAAQLGADITLCEERHIGGTCLNVGCIPTKSLLHTAGFYQKLKSNSVAGVVAKSVALDWVAAQKHKDELITRLTGGVDMLLRNSGVRVIRERALPVSGNRVQVGVNTHEADAVILATGSRSIHLGFSGNDLPEVIDSTAALSLCEIPRSILILGGGVIGIEFATLFSQLGVQVTILETQPQILPGIDPDAAAYLRESLEAIGVTIYTGAALQSAAKAASGITAAFDGRSVSADCLLEAVGRKPNTAGLNLEELGVELTCGAVAVDEHFSTNIPGLYAVGDCNGQNMLAHAAMAQGIAAAEHILGTEPHYNPNVVPSCVYSSPEVACVGMTGLQAADAGFDFSVGLFSLSGNGKALIEDGGGFVKIIADKRLGEVLGVHIVGPRASEMIAEAALCMSLEGTVEDIVNTIHAHPTVGEAVQEAAMSVFGKPIHGV